MLLNFVFFSSPLLRRESMEMKLMGWSLIVFGLVVMVLNNACPANGITCQEALMTLMPCEPYLVGSGPGSPTVPCCAGVQTLVSEATSTEIRRSLCECLKTAAAGMKIDPARLKAIPEYCKVSVPIPLDPSVDCSKVPLF